MVLNDSEHKRVIILINLRFETEKKSRFHYRIKRKYTTCLIWNIQPWFSLSNPPYINKYLLFRPCKKDLMIIMTARTAKIINYGASNDHDLKKISTFWVQVSYGLNCVTPSNSDILVLTHRSSEYECIWGQRLQGMNLGMSFSIPEKN